MGLLNRIAHSNSDMERTIAALRLMNEHLKRELDWHQCYLDRLSLSRSNFREVRHPQMLRKRGAASEDAGSSNLDSLSLVVSYYQAGQDLEGRGRLPEAIKQYQLADSLYQSEFLVEDRHDDCAVTQHESLKQIYLDILDRLSQFYLEQKQFAQCIDACRRCLAHDNCHEEAHRRLMQCYFSQGQYNLAIRQYQLCAELLAREFEVLPTPVTVQLYHQIQRNEVYFKMGRTSAGSTPQ